VGTVTIKMKNTYNTIYFLILFLFFGCSEIDKSFQEPLPDVVSYNTHIKNILDQSCVRCHGGAETQRDLDLSSYDIIDQRIGTKDSDIITPGNSFSLLLRKVGNGGTMHMYLNNIKDYELLYQWIVLDSVAQN